MYCKHDEPICSSRCVTNGVGRTYWLSAGWSGEHPIDRTVTRCQSKPDENPDLMVVDDDDAFDALVYGIDDIPSE